MIETYPPNRNKMLEQLPKTVSEESLGSMTEHVDEVFLEELNKKREHIAKRRVTKRHKKFNVRPRSSISATNVKKSKGSNVTTTSRESK